jgi:probable phosphoglycerate mutase
MSTAPGPDAVLVRHAQTEWSRSGRHTSRTDLPLDEEGEAQARALRSRLAGLSFDLVLSSPLGRAVRTAELAGVGPLTIDPDLKEWDYGDYDGWTISEIRAVVPGWTVWTGACPGGETIDQVAERVDRVVQRVRRSPAAATVAIFGHGHSLRVLAARWLGTEPAAGRWLELSPASVSRLSWEHDTPALKRWNIPDRPD